MAISAHFFMAILVLSTLAYAPTLSAADKAQAWGGKLPNTKNATMRNRNKSARIWIGEQARGWGVGSRISSSLTTSMNFHTKASTQALNALKENKTQIVRESVSACATCVSLENSGEHFAITNSVLTSINGASVTTSAEFSN